MVLVGAGARPVAEKTLVRRLESHARTRANRLTWHLREPAQLPLGGLDQRDAFREPVVAELHHLALVEVLRDVVQEARDREPVMKAEQRAAVRALDVDQPIEHVVPQHREQLTERATGHRADRLARRHHAIEARSERGGVSTDGAQCARGWRIAEAPCFSSRVKDRRPLALGELSTQLAIQLA